ncbi:MAG: hypothetical protein KatS3mg096_171 [Candidatus Parcubacteria bacterium]|nr:MAG: hypothetical protein KatS3mg096_171 [Candidatus Parcubacteria bacterium]
MNNNKNKILSNTKHHAVTQNKAITWFRSKSSEECRSNSTSKICLGRMKTFKLKHKRRPNWFIKPKEPQASFTLVELLVVLALIAILATVLIVVIKPTDIFKKGRDTKRVSDLSNIEKLLDSIYATDYTFSELQYASSNVVYISLPDSNPNCSSWLSQLPSLPSGFSYRCSATPENTDGTGWIPIPFSNYSILNIPRLFIDPINKPPYYYSFVAGGSYALYAQLENPQSQASKNDNDNYPHLYSAGTNKRLIDQAQGLVGYWSFDDCTAKDLSGNNNNGTLMNGPQCVDGKVGKALSFDGVDDYV